MASKSKTPVAPKPSKSSGEKRSASPGAAREEPAGKKAFLAMFADESYEETRTLKSTNSATPSVSVEAMVFRTNSITVKGKQEGQMVPKLEIWAFSHLIRHNGAPDYIDGGIPGMGYLLPSHKPAAAAAAAVDGSPAGEAEDDGPEAAVANKGKAKDKKSEPPRTVRLTDGHKSIWLGLIRTSVYTQGQKGETKDGVDLIKPGMVVEIAGNIANLGSDGKTLWLNASRVTPLRPEIASGNEVKTMIHELYQPDPAMASAFLASQCTNGFFNHAFSDSVPRELQAICFRKMWGGFLETTSKSCEALAMTLRSEGADDDANAKILDAHAQRVKAIKADDIASGNGLVFLPTMMPTEDRPPYCCPLIQSGKHPAMPHPSVLMDMIEGNLDKVPKAFCAVDVQAVEHQGATMNLKLRTFFVGDRDQAIIDLKKGSNPVISTGKFSSIGVKLNMREFCGILGSIVKDKAEMAGSELMIDADFVTLSRIVPKAFGADGLKCVFPEAFAVDMPSSIIKVAMPVTEKWVQTHLCGGNNQYVYEKDVEVVHIKDSAQKDVVVPLPQLKSHGYQAISESGFKFGLSKNPLSLPVKAYYVLFPGCRELMEAECGFSTADGEAEVAKAAGQVEMELAEFLVGKAVVYCVARAADGAAAGSAD